MSPWRPRSSHATAPTRRCRAAAGLRGYEAYLAAGILLLAQACAQPGPAPEGRYAPADTLLEIVKEFQRFQREDTYRYPAPKALSGVNVYKATLARLDDYARKYPARYPAIVAFTRAMALERLREYEQAAAEYERVAQLDGRLQPKALESLDALADFQVIRRQALPGGDPAQRIEARGERAKAWAAIAEKHRGTVYEFLAREEEEGADRERLQAVVANRAQLPDGTARAIQEFRALVVKHGESKSIRRYLLEFANFYTRLTEEYVASHDPEGLTFDSGRFDDLGNVALDLYAQVAREDGTPEKLEAVGRIEALKAYMGAIRTLNR